MKTILYVLILMSLFSLAFRPGTPPPPPPPTEPPVITEPPGTEPPEVTEPPSTEPPVVTEKVTPEPPPTERGRPNPEQQVTPGSGKPEAEQRVIKLPSGGYGPQEKDALPYLPLTVVVLIGLIVLFVFHPWPKR